MAAHMRKISRSNFNKILTKSLSRFLVIGEKGSREPSCSRCLCSHNSTPSRYGGVKQGLDKPHRRKILRQIKADIYLKNSSNTEMEKAARTRKLLIPLDDVRKGWRPKQYPNKVSTMANYYGIFDHMFDGTKFIPSAIIDINYGKAQSHYGNFIEPEKTSCEPEVKFSTDNNSLMLLFMVNLDGNIISRDHEVLHWMVGNIPNGNINEGEVVSGYIPPFPSKGTGFHRFVFCLVSQKERCDFGDIYKTHSTRNLASRSFKTVEFLTLFQEQLNPVGLSFFQAAWDPTVSNIFSKILGIKEPVYDLEPFLTPNQKKRLQVYDVFEKKYTNM